MISQNIIDVCTKISVYHLPIVVCVLIAVLPISGFFLIMGEKGKLNAKKGISRTFLYAAAVLTSVVISEAVVRQNQTPKDPGVAGGMGLLITSFSEEAAIICVFIDAIAVCLFIYDVIAALQFHISKKKNSEIKNKEVK